MNLLTTEEVAEILRCHRSTVQRMAQAGKFPGALAIGNGQRKSWRIPEAALQGLASDDEPKAKPKAITVGVRGWELYRKFSKS